MQLGGMQRAIFNVEGVLHKREMDLANLRVISGQIRERAIVHCHAGVVFVNLTVEAALVEVVVE